MNDGTFELSGNLQVKIGAPLDDRMTRNTYADLISSDSRWVNFAYVGMETRVINDPNPLLNKKYVLTALPVTDINNWKESSSGGTGDGATFIPSIVTEGATFTISWTNDGGLPNPDPITITAPTGETGQKGDDGSDGINGVTFTPYGEVTGSSATISWTNNGGLPNPDPITITAPKGDTGQKGTDGSNGATFIPVAETSGDTVTISWSNSSGLPNPTPATLKAPQGVNGATFTPHVTSVDESFTISWTNESGLPNPEPVTVHVSSTLSPAEKATLDGMLLFPYKYDQTGEWVTTISTAIRGLYIAGYNPLKRYYLAVVRRNDNGNVQISAYSRLKSDSSVTEIEFDIRFSTGDPANGMENKYTDPYGRGVVSINWDMLPIDFSQGGMWDGYELSDYVFSPANPLYIDYSAELKNVVPDPYFKYGMFMVEKASFPRIYGLSAGAISTIENGVLVASSSQATRKSYQVMITFDAGWADKFNAEVDQFITVGCYAKFELANIETATVEAWGADYNNTIGIPFSAIQTTPANIVMSTPLPTDDYVWFQRRVRLRAGEGIVPINDRLDIGLSYIRLTDPDATVENPTRILVKQPCVIMDSDINDSGFYPSSRDDDYATFELVRTSFLEVLNASDGAYNNLSITGNLDVDGNINAKTMTFEEINTMNSDLTISASKEINSELLAAPRIQMKENYTFPSDGVFIGMKGDQLVLSVNGTESLINITPITP